MRSYLDYNATTPLRESAKKAMMDLFEHTGNASSVHEDGRYQRSKMDGAREIIAELTGTQERHILFKSCGTEANNFLIKGLVNPESFSFFVSDVEHDSILKPFSQSSRICVLKNGLIDLDHLELLLKNTKKKPLVSIGLVGSETGIIQPLQEIIHLVHSYDGLIHSDCVQAAGKLKLSFDDWDLDFMTISSHKVGGALGAAAFYLKDPKYYHAWLEGGGQERGFRSGTQNVPALVSMAVALKESQSDPLDDIEMMRNELEDEIANTFSSKGVFVVGKDVLRVGNTSAICFPDFSSELQMMHHDLNGVSISAGSACSSGKAKPSHTLLAMGYDHDVARSTIRVSLGYKSTKQDCKKFVESILRLYEQQAL